MKKLIQVLLITLLLAYPLFAAASDLQVGWSPYADKADILGFKLKIGTTAGGPYPTVITIADPNLETYTITNFTTTFSGKKYYLVMTAYDANGESDNSNEAIYTKPFGNPRLIKLSIVGGRVIWVVVP